MNIKQKQWLDIWYQKPQSAVAKNYTYLPGSKYSTLNSVGLAYK